MISNSAKLNIEILRLPRATNLEDFDPLFEENDVITRFINMGDTVGDPDLFIIPGTKNTILDYQHIKKAGYLTQIKRLVKKNRVLLGIAGGFQMLGTKIIDIKGSENMLSKSEGMGFFQIVTRIMPSMVDSEVCFEPLPDKLRQQYEENTEKLSGFEIHLGRTKYLNGSQPMFRITERDGIEVEIFDGSVNESGNVLGTYIHRIFHNAQFRNRFIQSLRERRGN